jgi:hypothetical protein
MMVGLGAQDLPHLQNYHKWCQANMVCSLYYCKSYLVVDISWSTDGVCNDNMPVVTAMVNFTRHHHDAQIDNLPKYGC